MGSSEVLVIVAPNDVNDCQAEHETNAVQNAQILSSDVFNIGQQLISLSNITIPQIHNVLVDAHRLFSLPLQVDFSRNYNVFILFSLHSSST